MKRSVVLLMVVLASAAVRAATVNMNDPRRAVGTDENIRVDAQLTSDSVSPHSTIGVTYQVQNFSSTPIGVVSGECDASYDTESQTITLSLGLEVPKNGEMPAVVVIQPGEKRTFTTGAALKRAFMRVPRFVGIRVNLLRDLTSFSGLIEQQRRNKGRVPITDTAFDRWLESNESIELNLIPVHFRPAAVSRADASQR